MVVMGLLDSNKPNKIRNFLFSKENEFSETKVLIHLLVASGGKKNIRHWSTFTGYKSLHEICFHIQTSR